MPLRAFAEALLNVSKREILSSRESSASATRREEASARPALRVTAAQTRDAQHSATAKKHPPYSNSGSHVRDAFVSSGPTNAATAPLATQTESAASFVGVGARPAATKTRQVLRDAGRDADAEDADDVRRVRL